MTSSIQSYSLTTSSSSATTSNSEDSPTTLSNELFVCGLYTSGQTGLVRTPKVSVHQAQYYPQYYSFAEPCKLPPIFDQSIISNNYNSTNNLFNYNNNTREETQLETEEQSNENSLITCRETLNSLCHNHDELFANSSSMAQFADEKLKVKSIVCGWYHTVLLTFNGQVWSCGANYSHQAGQSQNSNVTQFTRINSIQEPVQMVSCGGHHSIALTIKGNLYVWGECREGQLGIVQAQPPISSTLPILLNPQTYFRNFEMDRRELLAELYRNQLLMDDEERVSEPTIAKLCCGGYHSIFVMSDGSVASCGKNTYGQCGTVAKSQSSLTTQDHEFKIYQPALLKEFEVPVNTPPRILREFTRNGEKPARVGSKYRITFNSIEIVDCAAGAWHSILITSEGKTFGMGDTQYGQLSIQEIEGDPTLFAQDTDSSNRHLIPHLITSLQDEKICAVACGYFHSVFLTYDGRVYTNGWNAYGQLLNGNTKTQRFVYPLKLLYGIPICKVACGWNHCVLLSRSGECYVGGEGKHGQLGYIQSQKTDEVQERMYHHTREDENQQNCFVCRPVRVDFFRNTPIKDVACGRGHTIFLTGTPNYSPHMNFIRKKLFIHLTTCNDFSDINIMISN